MYGKHLESPSIMALYILFSKATSIIIFLDSINKSTVFNKKIIKIDRVVAHLSLSGLENNYYHFLTECLSRFYLIHKSGYKPDYYIIANDFLFQAQMLELLGIRRDQIISNIDSNYLIQAQELIVADFINNYEPVYFRGFLSYQKQWLPGWVGNLYKKTLFTSNSNNKVSRIYISRSKAMHRKIKNEADVIIVYKKFGFDVYNLEMMKLNEQIKLFNSAQLISGVHGAGFTNMFFSNSNTIVFELFPEFYHDSGYKILAHSLGLKYYYLFGETIETENIHPQQEDVFIDLEKLEISLTRIFLENKLKL